MKHCITIIFIFIFSTIRTQGTFDYAIKPIPIQQVKLTDNFWLPIIERLQEKTIQYAIEKCKGEGRFDNFLIAGGRLKGDVKGAMPFDDTDVYKIIEGASNTLLSSPDENLEILLDSLISIISVGQEKDGYITTWRTINPAKSPAPWVKIIEGKRWESLGASHELYNLGHLYEAAAVHHNATGKHNFLDIAIKSANLLLKTFGDNDGQIKGVPGHQIVETGLIQLYKITKNANYLSLAKYFLDNRGNPNHHELYGPYSQDHKLVVDQDEAVGHAVRAVYMYAAMTDISVMYDNQRYKAATLKIWDNIINKKMYITGGIGARHDGEAFGESYELPNLTAYSETCAAIGNIYWNHRLHSMNGKVSYFDIIERTLYNSMISGLSLDGVHFFYPNPLEADGKYTFNRGACTRQSWFDCSCCPTNLIRFLPSITNLIYSQSKDDAYINLFVGSEVSIKDSKGSLDIKQQTEYPWNGTNRIEITNSSNIKKLKIRVPHFCRGIVMEGDLYEYQNVSPQMPSLKINGKIMDPEINEGYIQVDIDNSSKYILEVILPMEPRYVTSNSKIVENIGKSAMEYGPFVYVIESTDNRNDFSKIRLNRNKYLKPKWDKKLLGGILTLKNSDMKAIPYYAWSNRGISEMKVWIPNNN